MLIFLGIQNNLHKNTKKNKKRNMKLWQRDMNKMGVMLTKLLSRNCSFEVTKEATESPLSNFIIKFINRT